MSHQENMWALVKTHGRSPRTQARTFKWTKAWDRNQVCLVRWPGRDLFDWVGTYLNNMESFLKKKTKNRFEANLNISWEYCLGFDGLDGFDRLWWTWNTDYNLKRKTTWSRVLTKCWMVGSDKALRLFDPSIKCNLHSTMLALYWSRKKK